MDTIEPYLDIFGNITGSRNAGKGIHNNCALMVDPITLDVLKKLNLPTNIYDIMIFGNMLLETVTFKKMNDMSTYRIRCGEQIPAMVYNVLANAVREYKDISRTGNTNARITVPRDIVLKKLVELKTVDEHSVLSPSLEIERASSATYKGLSGINLDSAYTPAIRSYHPSMVGIMGFSTPDSDKVGCVRQLTLNAGILNTRGFLNTDKNAIEPSTGMFSPAELMTPLVVSGV